MVRINSERPWSNIGIDVSDKILVADAMHQAGVDFYVEVVPGYFPGNGKYCEAKGYNFIIRSDTKDVLGMCKGRFVPLQNHVMIDLAQPLINAGKAKLDTIGLFNKGEKVWMLVELPTHTYTIIGEDTVTMYLLLINGHDGSTSLMVGIIPFRPWCSNMFPRIGKQLIRFKHTESAEEMLSFFRLKLASILADIDKYVLRLQQLAHSGPGTSESLDDYFKNVFNIKEKEVSTRTQNKLDRLHELFQHGYGSNYSLVAGTWYAAFNAVTQYLNYDIGRSQESRLNSLWFGPNADTSQRALEFALKECN